MNAVIGMTGLLLDTELSVEQRDYAETVRTSGDALLVIINDILDFSKIESGRLELEAQPFSVRDCVEGSLDLVAAQAAAKGLDLACSLEPGVPPVVVGDVTRLRQVLVNLLSNAVKFTATGDVLVTVSRRRRAAVLRRARHRHRDPAPTGWTGCSAPSARSTPRPPGCTAGPAWAWPSAAGWPRRWAASCWSTASAGRGSTFTLRVALPARRADRGRAAGAARRAARPSRAGRRRQRHQPPDPAPTARGVGHGGRRRRAAEQRAAARRRRHALRRRAARHAHAGDGRRRAGPRAARARGHPRPAAAAAHLARPAPRRRPPGSALLHLTKPVKAAALRTAVATALGAALAPLEGSGPRPRPAGGCACCWPRTTPSTSASRC